MNLCNPFSGSGLIRQAYLAFLHNHVACVRRIPVLLIEKKAVRTISGGGWLDHLLQTFLLNTRSLQCLICIYFNASYI